MKSPWLVILSLMAVMGMTACSSKKAKKSSENADNTTEELVLESDSATANGTDAVPEEGTEFQKMADQSMQQDEKKVVDQLPMDDKQKTEVPAAEPQSVAEAQPAPQHTVGSGNFDDYHVQTSDTLMKIAYDVYGNLYDWKKIYEANQDRIKDPNLIPAGTVLKIEKPASPVATDKSGDKYLIKTGDTLGTISYDIYGTEKKWKHLWENNQQLIRDPNKIFAGFYLYYTITPEERENSERLKEQRGVQPLAKDKGAKKAKREAASDAPPQPEKPAAQADSKMGPEIEIQ